MKEIEFEELLNGLQAKNKTITKLSIEVDENENQKIDVKGQLLDILNALSVLINEIQQQSDISKALILSVIKIGLEEE